MSPWYQKKQVRQGVGTTARTRRVARSDRVRLSLRGRQMVEGRAEPILYEELDILLDHKCGELLLTRLSESEWELGRLLLEIETVHGFPEQVVLMHLDWFLKHGYLATQAE